MSRRFIIWLLSFVTLVLIQHLGDFPMLSYLLFFALLLPIVAFLWGLALKFCLTLRLIPERDYVTRLEPIHFDMELSNRSWLSALAIRAVYTQAGEQGQALLLQHRFRLAPRETVRLRLSLTAEHIGRLTLGPLHVTLSDPFGFFFFKCRHSKNLQAAVYVLPRVLMTDEVDSSYTNEAGLDTHPEKSHSQTDEIDRMRPFAPGDRIRLIHWKLSARLQKWMVRQFEQADERHLTFMVQSRVLSAEEGYTKEKELHDWVLEQMAADLRSLLNNAFRISLRTYSPEAYEQEARTLADFESLRMQLGHLSLPNQVPLPDQIKDFDAFNQDRALHIYTVELTPELCAELKALRTCVDALFLVLAMPTLLTREQKTYIEDLRKASIDCRVYQNLERYFR